MFKLMKYEWIRSRKLALITLAMFGILEIFLAFCLYKGGNWNVLFSVLTFLIGPMFYVILFVDSIRMLTNDLDRKSGYMLFLTPNNGFKIIGAKMLVTFVNFIIVHLLVALMFFVNYKISISVFKSAELPPSIEIVVTIMTKLINELTPPMYLIVGAVAIILLNWINFIITVYFAIIIRKTIMSNVKLKGLISFAIFIGLNIAESMIKTALALLFNTTLNFEKIFDNIEQFDKAAYVQIISNYEIYSLIIPIIFIIPIFVISSKMLERIDL